MDGETFGLVVGCLVCCVSVPLRRLVCRLLSVCLSLPVSVVVVGGWLSVFGLSRCRAAQCDHVTDLLAKRNLSLEQSCQKHSVHVCIYISDW